jgi:phenylacetate-coenzyme A ligase PaaK-like adenylate-forming protein
MTSIAGAAQRWTAAQVVRRGLRDRQDLLAEREALYARVNEPDRIARRQLDAFNAIWAAARRRYRFYGEWQRRHRLPERIDDLAELASFPLLRSIDIEENLRTIAADAAPCRLVRTGGTTGRPRYYPRGPEDDLLHHASMYLGRGWAGIRAGDPIALIWSHTHLFGHGLKGRFNVVRRHVKDWLIGTRRLSAYSLDDASLARHLAYMRARPGMILVGYASCIRKLLDYVERTGYDGAAAKIRAAIFCSETVHPRDLERVRDLLAAEPLIEYGMQETGVMAYSRPGTGELTFFWDAFHARVEAEQELAITTLLPVRFPLINFATGDRVETVPDGDGPPFRCARILGRARDVLSLPMQDGSSIDTHSDFFFDILQIDDGVSSFFVHQKGSAIDIGISTGSPEDLRRIGGRFLHEIAREFPAIDRGKITFSMLADEPYTVAGKRRYFLREP